jgi:hypothetical protein
MTVREIEIALQQRKAMHKWAVGLLVWPPEKKARKLACRVESDTLSGPAGEQKLRNCGDFLRFSEQGSRISSATQTAWRSERDSNPQYSFFERASADPMRWNSMSDIVG